MIDAQTSSSSAVHPSLGHCAVAPSVAARAAATSCSLLLTGETGTGKGHLARWIHEHSARSTAAFVPVNCGAVPDGLVDSHLFGHVRGAFSGATADHQGLVRAAAGGTLLLDEIGELPPTAQVRLLRLLEEREIQPVGQSRPVRVDVRIIAATHGDLAELVRQGRFRQDLYFRLDIVRIHLSPLRERTDLIAPLLDGFNDEFAAVYRQPALVFSDEARRMLHVHRWPGNIRELRSLIERLHVLCGGEAQITPAELRQHGSAMVQHDKAWALPIHRMHQVRLEAASRALDACRGNISRAASALGVHRSTVYRWMAATA